VWGGYLISKEHPVPGMSGNRSQRTAGSGHFKGIKEPPCFTEEPENIPGIIPGV